ncbi:TetR/AcrR family transcriptional regulator [Actinokineospora enzanensis]|uniref:TetR/AcrR family transcriptional regulator n=1 Tax=Actinokineospora enzanensis TaxID=155975 RepID=UPI0003A28370|nr:hypothetical protein [Actinokineospora enzanensis]
MASRVGRPARLSVSAIVAAAMTIVRADGVAGLSMRKPARKLDSTPMARYHVRDKDELLLLLLDEHARAFPRPRHPAEPRARLPAAARTLHAVLVDWPAAAGVLTADDLVTPSARWVVEDILDAAIARGLAPERAIHAYRVIWCHTAGRLCGHPRRTDTEVDPDIHPRLAELCARWPATHDQDQGLSDVVTGLLSVH